MKFRWMGFALALVVTAPASVPAQQQSRCTGDQLACIIPTLYGPDGLIVDSDFTFHTGHFTGPFEERFLVINQGLARELSSQPIPSPAAGLTYSFDPTTGTFNRSTKSFGPIFGERAETIGKKRLSLGFNFQHFTFESIDGVSLDAIPAVLEHDPPGDTFGRDIISTRTSIDGELNQFTGFLTYGLLDRLDVSVAVPIVRTQLDVVSEAVIQRIGSFDSPRIHFFGDSADRASSTKVFARSGTATGIGDVILRAKGTLWKKDPAGLALGMDVRLPTGDEMNLLGSGAWGLKPFAAASTTFGRFGARVNAAYQWNGASVLGGDVRDGDKRDLQDLLVFGAGADVSVLDSLTVAVDFIGRHETDSTEIVPEVFTAATAGRTFPSIRIEKSSLTETALATGFKFNPGGNLLLDFNVLFRLNDRGLKHRPTPLAGIEYSF